MSDPLTAELLKLNQTLLDSIAAADWETYAGLCDPTLTCFEPESCGHLVEGLAFHKFYFELGAGEGPRATTMASPHVRVLGASAVISYVRLVQRLDASKSPVTTQVQETRVWRLESGQWRHVHIHRSFHG
jgi:calcium/calmodulin-dependent protein kinase (CaM kinase) II